MFRSRSKSLSSSSSSSSSNSSRGKHGKRSKHNSSGINYAAGAGIASPTLKPDHSFQSNAAPTLWENQPSSPPPYYAPQNQSPPPSGFRIPLTTSSPFPPPQQTSRPCAFDADGKSPVFFGSALFSNSVHPCKICPNISPPCHVAYGGREVLHQGRYDLLPFDERTMELVPASGGYPPQGRRMVEGGYEERGEKLYHAIAYVGSVRVPGKVGSHLGGANIAFGGAEYQVTHNYEVLCWKD